MNWLEKDIAKYERRIKKIEENPDPNKLASNKLFYENERDLEKAQLAAWQEGRPITYYPGLGLPPVLKNLGFEMITKELVADKIGVDEEYSHAVSFTTT